MVDVIIQHLQEPEEVQLTQDQEELLARLKNIDRWMMVEPPMAVAKKACTTFDISEATAWRYMQYAQQVFNSISTARDSQFGMRLFLDWIYDARQMAIEQKDVKAYVQLIKALVDAFDIKDFNPSAIDPKELKQHNYLMVFNVQHPDGVERKQTINLNELDKLPEEQRQQFIQDIQEEMVVDDMDDIMEGQDEQE